MCKFQYIKRRGTAMAAVFMLLLLGGFVRPLHAQDATGTVAGRVTANGQAAPNAGVLITGGANNATTRTATDATGNFTATVAPGAYTVTAVAYGYNRATASAQTVTAGQTTTVPDLALTATTLQPQVYDDFNGSALDTSKWRLFTEVGANPTTAEETGGELILHGPGDRAGVLSTAALSATASVSEVTVNSVENFPGGGINAIMQLYTGGGGFTNFIEFGIEGTDAATGLPLLHVWGPESGDFAGPAPSDFPIKLSAVRHGNDLDFFANQQWVFSTTTHKLQGDHHVFLYGYGTSVPHFDSVALGSSAAGGGTLTGKVTAAGQGVANAGILITGNDATFRTATDASGNFTASLLPGTYTVTVLAYGYDTASSSPQTVTLGGTAVVKDLILNASTLFTAAPYDEFTGDTLDTTKWTPFNEAGTDEPSVTVANGEAAVAGPGGGNRAGILSTATQPAAASMAEAVVNGVDDFGPGGHNAILQLRTEGGGNVQTVEFGIEGVNGTDNRPMLHVWNARDYYEAPAPSGFPIRLTIVRHNENLDFYANKQWLFSTTAGLQGDHRVFLYGFGESVPHFDSVLLASGSSLSTLNGQLTVGGTPVANGAAQIVNTADNSVVATLPTDANGNFTATVSPGSYAVAGIAYGYERTLSAPVTVGAGTTVNAPALSLTPFQPSPLTVYDDFNGTGELDPAKWTLVNEAPVTPDNPEMTTPTLDNGELVLQGPGGRAGVMTTAKLSATDSMEETTVNSVDSFGGGGTNAIMQLYTGDGGFNNFVEYGIETTDVTTGRPVLHVWDTTGEKFHGPAPTDFPIKLTVARHNNNLDFFANGQWVFSYTTASLVGDNRVFLYGYGGSVPHFDNLAMANSAVPTQKKGDVNGDGSIDVGDAVLDLQIIVGTHAPTDAESQAGNVNGDATIDVSDAVLILQFITGLITQFPGS